ncbi:MAG: sensor histidine kinase [Sphingobium sp.]|nr:sensor histidine kinase [Sphingobium sp.]
MFFILTMALLPLGIIALLASLQAIRTADVERDSLLRVTVLQSARKLAGELAADQTALRIAANSFAAGTADPGMCQRIGLFLKARAHAEPRFFIYDRSGSRLCGSPPLRDQTVPAAERFAPRSHDLLPGTNELILRTFSDDRRVVAISHYGRAHLGQIADPATALQDRRLTLMQKGRSVVIGEAAGAGPPDAQSRSVSARVDPSDIMLTMTVREPPATLWRLMSLFLPLLMAIAAATFVWIVVNRLLIRPLVLLRRAVAAYQPGEVMQPLARMRTPAKEIADLGETFRAISEDVATHEAEMAEGLDRQRKLTREVHHRVKNNLQIIASLINLHARSAVADEAVEAYASIQRRVDALSVVHRNHFAELEENRGVGVRPLISELSASLRGTAPASARRFAIQIDADPMHISQDVAVPVAFLLTELVELAMMAEPTAVLRIGVRALAQPGRACLTVASTALRASPDMEAQLHERYSRVMTGLSRQLRAPLEHDPEEGEYRITISTTD